MARETNFDFEKSFSKQIFSRTSINQVWRLKDTVSVFWFNRAIYFSSSFWKALRRSSGVAFFQSLMVFSGNTLEKSSNSLSAMGQDISRSPVIIMLTAGWLIPSIPDMYFCLIFMVREDYHPLLYLSIIFFTICNIFFKKGLISCFQ